MANADAVQRMVCDIGPLGAQLAAGGCCRSRPHSRAGMPRVDEADAEEHGVVGATGAAVQAHESEDDDSRPSSRAGAPGPEDDRSRPSSRAEARCVDKGGRRPCSTEVARGGQGGGRPASRMAVHEGSEEMERQCQ